MAPPAAPLHCRKIWSISINFRAHKFVNIMRAISERRLQGLQGRMSRSRSRRRSRSRDSYTYVSNICSRLCGFSICSLRSCVPTIWLVFWQSMLLSIRLLLHLSKRFSFAVSANMAISRGTAFNVCVCVCV